MTFDALFVPAQLRDAVSDEAWVRAMLEAERALAAAEARVGVISEEDAAAVADVCGRDVDVDALFDEGRRVGNPVEPLVRRLREDADRVHWAATSQDILDTAAALVARDASRIVAEELDRVASACADLADRHRGTVMAGRTLLQQAVPITFGLKVAGWLVGVVAARERVVSSRLPAQLGGAAGTLAALDDRGVDVLRAFAEELELAEPIVPWHVRRLPVAELGSALAIAAGFVAKIALDVLLLAQTEVGEVREAGDGSSSTMPHKRNPVCATLTRACALRAQAAASVLTAALEQEHERAAGAWHAEWSALSDALALTGAAASWAADMLERLEVDAERMHANLGEESLSEAERFGLGAPYLGSSEAFVDRALDFYRNR